ncbi:MAG: NAD(P)/FAD-dependent oxidoreductase [Patescibacteria group bacterium]
MRELVIIGGGLTGLSCAYFASRMGYKVTVLEASNKVGGLMSTFEVGGGRLEKFYHHFFTHDTEFLWLLKELGISDKLMYQNSSMGVFSNGKIYNFNGPLDLLKMNCLNIEDKIRFGATSLYLSKMANWKDYENFSTYDWFIKYAGKNVTKIIWEPLLRAKFGSYYNKVPVSWMIGRLSQRVNSRKGGREKLGYLKGSTDVLLKALTSKLQSQNVKLITDVRAEKFITENGIIKKIATQNGDFSGDVFVSTIPTCYLSKLVKGINTEYAKDLSKIEYFGAMCFIYELTEPLSKIYWLNIAEKDFSFGGVIEHTNLISADNYNNSHIVYLSRYFSPNEEIANLDNAEVERIMSADLCKIYPKFSKSIVKNTYLFKTKTAATVCNLNFSKKVLSCKTPISNLFTVNMSHIYPDERSCNNSIRTAAKACKVMGIDTSYVSIGRSLSGLIGMD